MSLFAMRPAPRFRRTELTFWLCIRVNSQARRLVPGLPEMLFGKGPQGRAEDLADRINKGVRKVSETAKGVKDSLKK